MHLIYLYLWALCKCKNPDKSFSFVFSLSRLNFSQKSIVYAEYGTSSPGRNCSAVLHRRNSPDDRGCTSFFQGNADFIDVGTNKNWYLFVFPSPGIGTRRRSHPPPSFIQPSASCLVSTQWCEERFFLLQTRLAVSTIACRCCVHNPHYVYRESN